MQRLSTRIEFCSDMAAGTRCSGARGRRDAGSGWSAVAAIIALALAGLPIRGAGAEDVDRIVLRVNEEILTLYEYEQRKSNEIALLLSSPGLDAEERQARLEEVGRMVMQSSFSEMLLLSFANQHGIRISESEVDEAVRELMKRQGIENDAQLQQALASSNMTLEEVRENARRELLWQQVVGREVRPKVKISEEELRAYYRNHQDEFRTPEERWLKEVIVLESSGLEDAELRRIAEEIHSQLAAGGDPETVVEPYRDQEITTGLIDLDWLRAEELEASLAAAAWALKPGEFSPPVAARGGYHILHVAGLREEQLLPLDEVEDRIMRREYGSRFNRELRVFLAELEKNAYIQESLPPESVGYRNVSADFLPEDELEVFRAPNLPVGGPESPEDTADEPPADSSGR